MKTLAVLILLGGFLFWGSFSGWAQPSSLFAGSASPAVPLSDQEMASLRGGYLGFFFEVVFQGFWDTTGRQWATVEVQGGFGQDGKTFTPSGSPSQDSSGNPSQDPPGIVPKPSGDLQVKSSTVLGGFQGAQGIFQINQVPGSGNIVRNGLVINLYIFQQPPNPGQVNGFLNQVVRP